ncbi:MAG: protease complex subunit PrcB family protein, partial [Acidobacteriota bacterium]
MTSDIATIARGDGSAVSSARRSVARDPAEWRALWAAHAGPAAAAPAVDFETRLVAAAFAGDRPSAGFEIAITGTRREGPLLTVLVAEQPPAPGAMAAQLIVSPFHIVSLPRHDGEVRFSDGAE